jgi:hypothetical protein
MEKIEGGVHSLKCAPDLFTIHRIALEDLDLITPWKVFDLARITNHHSHIKSFCEECADEAATDIPRCACDKYTTSTGHADNSRLRQ